MKIMKDKKVFGALNILDIAIIVFILILVLPMLHYYIKFNERGYAEHKALDSFIERKAREDVVTGTFSRTKLLDVDCSFKNLAKADLVKIKAGDKELSKDGSVIAEILWVGEPGPNYFVVDIGRPPYNRVFASTVPEASLYSLPARFRLKGLIADSGAFTYKDKSVNDLTLFRFDSGKYEAYFVIENNKQEGR